MKLFGMRFGSGAKSSSAAAPRASVGEMLTFTDLNDPALAAFMQVGGETAAGTVVTPENALRNPAILRAVNLISRSIGMLPLRLYENGDDPDRASEHPLNRILAKKPNGWQTPFTFKSTMQLRALIDGDAYAYPIRSRGNIIRLVPMRRGSVTWKQNDDWSVEYTITRPNGSSLTVPEGEMFHLRDTSLDGVGGLSRVRQAREAIGLAKRAEEAAARLFKNGMLLGGYLTKEGNLSQAAQDRLKEQMAERYSGAEAAQKWMVLEEGLRAEKLGQTSVESQHLETRKHQIEEIARTFDVPRPLLMMDETSWGSGIEQLGLFFITFGLAPWFVCWEQEISRVLLTEAERDRYYAKFNERALLRGSLKDQAEFFKAALGAGGQDPWMTVDEVREKSDLKKAGGDSGLLHRGYGQKSETGKESGNEPAKTA